MSAATTEEATTGQLYGANVLAHLESKGITVAELARRTGIPRSSLSRKLHTGNRVLITEVFYISEALEVDWIELWPEGHEPSRSREESQLNRVVRDPGRGLRSTHWRAARSGFG